MNKTTESQSAREDERTETTIPEAIVWAFLGWMERNAERLCELCVSVVKFVKNTTLCSSLLCESLGCNDSQTSNLAFFIVVNPDLLR